jgi:hypothetical protein
MNHLAEQIANQAIFQLQFNTRDAVRYVIRNSGVDFPTAQQVVKSVITFYKK